MAVAALPEADFVLAAISGGAGLRSTAAAVDAGKPVGLANKESLVLAGELVMRRGRRAGRAILPVDSEHSAIFQSLVGHNRSEVRRLILTASGGPLRNHAGRAARRGDARAEALRHPNWSMGAKITIDSATLMNKGLEVIEARWLFDVEPSRIDILVHPESIVHSMVEYVDGQVVAQLGVSDMRGPISYALAHPDRIALDLPPLDLARVGRLTFEHPDPARFPAYGLAYRALEMGGTAPAALSGADEGVVEAFLAGRCSLRRHRADLRRGARRAPGGAARVGGAGHRGLRLGPGRGAPPGGGHGAGNPPARRAFSGYDPGKRRGANPHGKRHPPQGRLASSSSSAGSSSSTSSGTSSRRRRSA